MIQFQFWFSAGLCSKLTSSMTTSEKEEKKKKKNQPTQQKKSFGASDPKTDPGSDSWKHFNIRLHFLTHWSQRDHLAAVIRSAVPCKAKRSPGTFGFSGLLRKLIVSEWVAGVQGWCLFPRFKFASVGNTFGTKNLCLSCGFFSTLNYRYQCAAQLPGAGFSSCD